MTNIDKHTFLKYFVPTETEKKRIIMFENGSSIQIKYKSEFKFMVQYLPGNYADYYSPNLIFNMKDYLKIIPFPNFYSFLFVPITLLIFILIEEIEKDIIWKITLALILFIILVQLILIYPSIQHIKKRVNEKFLIENKDSNIIDD